MELVAFFLALVLSFVPMWVYAYIVYWLDRFEREPKRLLLGVFLWGAFVATIGAVIAELILGEGLSAMTATAVRRVSPAATMAAMAPASAQVPSG